MTDSEQDRVPDPLEQADAGLEREAESEAAEEAGAIGGPAPDYAGDEADRPLEESGEGVAEGNKGRLDPAGLQLWPQRA